MGPSVLTSSTASGDPAVAAAMDTFEPSAVPPSTTARTPSWRRIASASDWSSLPSTLSRRATTTPLSAACAASVFASASLDCWRSAESSFSVSRCRSVSRPMAASSSSGSLRNASAADRTSFSRSTAR